MDKLIKFGLFFMLFLISFRSSNSQSNFENALFSCNFDEVSFNELVTTISSSSCGEIVASGFVDITSIYILYNNYVSTAVTDITSLSKSNYF
jgi:hypothetical protein